MTTVILTIVGIVLAAASALMMLWYGGDSFESGASKAEAATFVEAVTQISHAVRLKEASEGIVYPSRDIQTLVSERYMSSIPKLPGSAVYLMDETGCAGCLGPKSIGVVYAMADTEKVRAMCAHVERSVGHLRKNETYSPRPRTMLAALAQSRTGCSWDGANFFVYAGF